MSEPIITNSDDPEPKPDEFASRLALVKTFALIAGVIGGVAGLCMSIGYLMKSQNPNMRGVIAAPFVCAAGAAAMVAGLALLFAPTTFFQTERGQEYLKMVGTQNVGVARIVILIFLLLGCGAITLFTLGALQIAGVIPTPPH